MGVSVYGPEAKCRLKPLDIFGPCIGVHQSWRTLASKDIHELLGIPLRHGHPRIHRHAGSVIGGDDIIKLKQPVPKRRGFHFPDIYACPSNTIFR